jgi:hypothetical protein
LLFLDSGTIASLSLDLIILSPSLYSHSKVRQFHVVVWYVSYTHLLINTERWNYVWGQKKRMVLLVQNTYLWSFHLHDLSSSTALDSDTMFFHWCSYKSNTIGTYTIEDLIHQKFDLLVLPFLVWYNRSCQKIFSVPCVVQKSRTMVTTLLVSHVLGC